jgi:2'-5' RNA ligase
MECGKNGAQPINSFALVTYVPQPLGAFLDDLRLELVPGCLPRAHVTILPPRPLEITPEQAWSYIQSRIQEVPPFEVELTRVEIFDVTQVIYLAIGAGSEELKRLHALANTGPVAFAEPFPYHPHITLAQQLPPEEVAKAYEVAVRRWAECPYERRFSVETITFVQNSDENRWIDLARWTLGAVPVR